MRLKSNSLAGWLVAAALAATGLPAVGKPGQPEVLQGVVTQVIDGDTLRFNVAGQPAIEVRLAQIDHLIALVDTLYPALRLYVFDAHRVFSAPVTVFGPHLAVIYLGQQFVVFRDPDRVMQISQHFDWLVRASDTGAREAAGHLRALRSTVGPD